MLCRLLQVSSSIFVAERRNAIARQIADKDIKVYSSAIWQIKENCK